MTDYSKMNDRDIDRLVLKVIYGVHTDDKDIQGCWSRGGFKYTTNPTDAMPIIIENKISIVSTDSSWIALPDNAVIDGITGDATEMIYADDSCVIHANPLRAAMIVFLQMQENNHD